MSFDFVASANKDCRLSKDHTDNPATRGVAEFVANLQYEQIPEDVRHRAKRLILDALGCGLFGANLEWSRILMTTLGQFDTSTGCSFEHHDDRHG